MKKGTAAAAAAAADDDVSVSTALFGSPCVVRTAALVLVVLS